MTPRTDATLTRTAGALRGASPARAARTLQRDIALTAVWLRELRRKDAGRAADGPRFVRRAV